MNPEITELYGEYGVDVGRIVRRIVKYVPTNCLHELNEIKILDYDPQDIGFAKYYKEDGRIELFVSDIIGWQPWLLKKSVIFPFLSIGLALGHEIDHHVNRNNNEINKEVSAEKNALKYVYPSFGIFKPIIKLLSLMANKRVNRQAY